MLGSLKQHDNNYFSPENKELPQYAFGDSLLQNFLMKKIIMGMNTRHIFGVKFKQRIFSHKSR